ncbi:hypothetical protein GCK32_018050 [Trichostrongylus colubriformis]|uniref:Uncharacterized protein n=1 Tax=Trichostrongylus colubriformis TaxID=6319 RepID=A0AAN8F9W2_TRICO
MSQVQYPLVEPIWKQPFQVINKVSKRANKPVKNGRSTVNSTQSNVLTTESTDPPELTTFHVISKRRQEKLRGAGPVSKVTVLLDTGAVISFVDSSLAERPVLEETSTIIDTFGSVENRECHYKVHSPPRPSSDYLFWHYKFCTIYTRALEAPKLPLAGKAQPQGNGCQQLYQAADQLRYNVTHNYGINIGRWGAARWMESILGNGGGWYRTVRKFWEGAQGEDGQENIATVQ